MLFRSAELGADVICIEAMGLHGGNAQSAGMCAILGGSKLQESKRFAFPEYPFDARKLTDWAMDEYHYAADPHLIYRIAESGGPCIDWMADCGVQWRLGEVPVYVAPKNSTLDHHVLKMKDATDAMFSFGQRHGVDYHFQCPAEADVYKRQAADRVNKRRIMAVLDVLLALTCAAYLALEGTVDLIGLSICALIILYAAQSV